VPHSPCLSGDSAQAKQSYAQRSNHNTPVQTSASTYPIIGIAGLLGLVALVTKLQAAHRMMPKEGAACPTEPFPPPVDQDIPLSWGRLPPANRQRLVALLSRWLARQLAAHLSQEENGDDHRS
jgi:hypothetical protein